DEMDTPRDTALADEMVIHITRAKTITIDTGDGKQVQTLLAKGTVQQALDKAGVKLGTADEVDTSLDTAVTDEMMIHIIRAKTVTIDTGDGKQAKALLAKGTVQQALDKAGVKLGTEDAIDTPLDTVIKGDMAVKIMRAKKIQIKAKAGDKTVMLATGTVKDALDKSGLTYDTEDEISPSLETKISDGMTIKLVRLNTKVHTRTVKIAFQTIQKKSNRVERGTTDVSQKGQEGVRTIKEKVVYKDGKEVKRVEISNEVTKQPVNKIVLIGTGPPMNPAIKGLPETPTSKMIIRKVTVDQITAYTHTGRRTATGKWPKVGMCAVNRRIFPYGTMFYVPGYGYAVAEDTGANNSSKVSIDLFMDTKEDCLRWGRKRNVTVTIVRRP
ncbi:MAG: ubiquitin-like domain-containing protein, partial [Acutalibacteraceae bacterium]